MKIKCGTDIIEIDRIKSSIENTGEGFLNRVYTKNTILRKQKNAKIPALCG